MNVIATYRVPVKIITRSPAAGNQVITEVKSRFGGTVVTCKDPKKREPCDLCGASPGHDWLCPILIDDAARHIAIRQRPLLRKLFPKLGIDETIDATVAMYEKAHGDDCIQARHWKAVRLAISQLGRIA